MNLFHLAVEQTSDEEMREVEWLMRGPQTHDVAAQGVPV